MTSKLKNLTILYVEDEEMIRQNAVELQLIKYIVKPITSAKLQESLSLSLDYLNEKESNVINIDEVTLYDILNKSLFINNNIVKLTLLLHLLATNRQRVVNYEEIENTIWAYEGMSMDALRSLVRVLRKKLEGDFVENISGIGYRLITIKKLKATL